MVISARVKLVFLIRQNKQVKSTQSFTEFLGCGLNLYNKDPTVCVNDLIDSINKETGSKIPELTYEIYFANVFNKLEELYKMAQAGNIDDVKSMYYSFWLHR